MDGPEGLPGMDALGEPFGEDNPARVPASRACASARMTSLRLPKRYRGAERVLLTVAGRRRSVAVSNRRVKVDLRRLRCGYFPILVQKRGVRSALFVWRLTPRRIVRQSSVL